MRRLPLLLLLYSLRRCCGDSAGSPSPAEPSASPRQIQLTEGATGRGELVLWMPLTVILPSLASQSDYTYSARSQRRPRTEQYDGPGREPAGRRSAYDWTSAEYRAAGSVGPLLSRVDAYFHYLRIGDEPCRWRTICQLAQQVSALEPVSGLLLRALSRESDGGAAVSAEGRAAAARFELYQTAAERGLFGADCASLYGQCGADVRQLINMPVLQLWQWLSDRLALHISDD
ncbi:hypothetical protein FJT64_027008 [Amphibalanus amphitrite]|uniref:Uncharacterized protein n=1 Tax=Amphibalanus amphitrite TaxID=1232801 RepID=A0A6A4W5A7_AMPAM|nr:hypothetical protein FJT64_027008 [Amphibalanus amphitrite]